MSASASTAAEDGVNGSIASAVEKLRLLMTLATNSVRIAVPVPRYMFQQLQHTEVRLMAVLNGKAVVGEEASGGELPLRQDQSHKLHVFGIIQQRCKVGQPIRPVGRVRISISLVFHQQPTKMLERQEKPLLVVEKTVKLHNDYFTSHILLDLRRCSPVKYQLIMKASLIDTSGASWETRDTSSCIVKVESMLPNTSLTKMIPHSINIR